MNVFYKTEEKNVDYLDQYPYYCHCHYWRGWVNWAGYGLGQAMDPFKNRK